MISIISLLSSVVMAGLNNAKIKARDAKRQADMEQIYKALNLFYDTYGCLPFQTSTACGNAVTNVDIGGWDYSSQGGSFLPFLVSAGYFTTVPVDPVNNMTGNSTPAGTFAYRYYCYVTGQSAVGLHLGYWSERTGGYILKNVINDANWADNTFLCK